MNQVNTILQSIKTDLAFISQHKKTPTPKPTTKPVNKLHTLTSPKPTKDQLDRDLDEVKQAHDREHDREHEYIISKLESLQKEAKLLGIDDTALGGIRSYGRGRHNRARGSRLWGNNSLRGRSSRALTWTRATAGSGNDSEGSLTCAIKLSGLPEGNVSVESIRNYIAQFGEVKNIITEGTEAIIQMNSRSAAEGAIEKGYTINGVPVSLSWGKEALEESTESQRSEYEIHTEEPVVEEYFRKDGAAASDSDNDDYK